LGGWLADGWLLVTGVVAGWLAWLVGWRGCLAGVVAAAASALY